MTPDEEAKLRLLSDGVLLDEAIGFAADIRLPAKQQINGLLGFSRGEWQELEKYVKHQADERNWQDGPGGTEHPTKEFYREMKSKLKWLREQAQASGLVPGGLTDKQTKEYVNTLAARLAGEFVQHLAAEMLYRHGGE